MTLKLINPSPLNIGHRLVFIDALKGYALILVLLYHVGGVLGWQNWLHGEVGVDIFLLVSGFTLTVSSQGMPAKQFITRRLLRIFPAYWLALLLFCVMRTVLLHVPPSGSSLWLHIFGLHAYAPGIYFSDINDSFWFISMILGLYVVFLLIRNKLADLSFPIGLGLILTTVASFAYIAANHGGGLIQLAVRIPSFFAGVTIAHFLSRTESRLSVSPWLIAGLVGLTALGWSKGVIPFYLVACLGMTAAFIGIYRLLNLDPDYALFIRPLAFLGVYSYEIFLFHQPLIRDYNYYVYRNYFHIEPTSGQVGLGIIIAMIVTIGLSMAVHVGVERLFRRWRQKTGPTPLGPVVVG